MKNWEAILKLPGFMLKSLFSVPYFVFVLFLVMYVTTGIWVSNNFAFFNDLTIDNDAINLSPKTQEDKSIVVGITKIQDVQTRSQDIFDFDPILTSGANEFILEHRRNFNSLLFTSLFKNLQDEKLDNQLVENWSTSDAKTYEITLKENIFWQDNTPITTEDVIFTFNQLRQANQGSPYFGAVQGGQININKTDAKNFNVVLENANAFFLYELTFPILPAHILKNIPQAQLAQIPKTDFGKLPVSSGPFKVIKKNNKEMVLYPNEKYNLGHNYKYHKITYRLYEDYNEISTDMQLKKLDMVYTKNAALNPELTVIHNLSTKQVNIFDQKYVLFFNFAKSNLENPFNQNIGLRNALLQIINRKQIADNLNLNTIYGPIDSRSFAYTKQVEEVQEYNPEGFRELVEELGYTKPEGEKYYKLEDKELTIELTYPDDYLSNRIINELKTEIEANGIKLQEQKLDLAETNLQDIINKRDFSTLLINTNEKLHPDRYDQWHSSRIAPPGQNLSAYDVKFSDILLEEARKLTPSDTEKLKDKYVDFQEIFYTEVPAIYIANPYINVYYMNTINGEKLPNNLNTLENFYYLYL